MYTVKPKTKSSKTLTKDQLKKSTKKLNDSKIQKNFNKKTEEEVRRNLSNTFKLLQSRLNIKQQSKNNTTILGLSQSIYDMVQKNLIENPQKNKKSGVPTQDSSEQSSIHAGKANEKQRSYSSHSNSIMSYFQQKFSDTAVDQKSVQKKLKALQALKKSQQISNKHHSNYNLSVSSIHGIDCETKQIVVGKLKKKSNGNGNGINIADLN